MIPDTRHKSHKSCKLFVTDLTLIGSSMILLSLSYNSTFIIQKVQEDCSVFLGNYILYFQISWQHCDRNHFKEDKRPLFYTYTIA